jgi:hypothetical protein
MLAWLRGQAKESSFPPPLLTTFQTALCNALDLRRQEGAAHLLASLAPDLLTCPGAVIQAFLPPLLQLANVLDIPGIPAEIRACLPEPAATPSSQNVADYAFIVLHLLAADGPAGWLHKQWLIWDREQPALLTRLTHHSLELDYLFTPVDFSDLYDEHWQSQEQIGREWKQQAQQDAHSLQERLLGTGDTTRYPHSFFFWQMLTAEQQAPSEDWRAIWDRGLQNEMQRGRGATYQTCLLLRLLLWKDNRQQQQAIARTLLADLSASDQRHMQALISFTNIYLRDLRDLRDLRSLRDLRDLRDMRDLRALRALRALRDLRDLRYLRDLRDMRYLIDLRDMRYLIDLIDLRDMRDMINKDQLVSILCRKLEQGQSNLPHVLLALYSIVHSFDKIPAALQRQVQDSLSTFTQQAAATLEQRLLVRAIRRDIGTEASQASAPFPMHNTPDQRALALGALKQRSPLRLVDAQEILAACADTRDVSQAIVMQLLNDKQKYNVGEIAWRLLSQAWSMTPDAWAWLGRALHEENALICAAAALLLQRGKDLPQQQRAEAMQSIQAILADEELSRRPLDTPGSRFTRLDDVLFEALRALAE